MNIIGIYFTHKVTVMYRTVQYKKIFQRLHDIFFKILSLKIGPVR